VGAKPRQTLSTATTRVLVYERNPTRKAEDPPPAFPQVAGLLLLVGARGFEPLTPSASRKLPIPTTARFWAIYLHVSPCAPQPTERNYRSNMVSLRRLRDGMVSTNGVTGTHRWRPTEMRTAPLTGMRCISRLFHHRRSLSSPALQTWPPL
jgi:hypothetical protein